MTHRLIVLGAGIITACSISGCMWGQRYFFYPSPRLIRQPETPFENVWIDSTDGVRLHGWFLPAGNARATVLFCHGNAQNISYHYPIVARLPAAGYNLLIFDYRGYGRSTGKPTLRGAVEDVWAAIDYLRHRPDVAGSRLIVYGQSLGGALALTAVGRYRPPGIAGIVADSTFPSYVRIAREKLRQHSLFPFWLLACLLIRDTYSPERYLPGLAPIPLLVLHGEADQIVPVHHGRELFSRAEQPKFFRTFADRRHIQACRTPEYRRVLLQFFEQCLQAGLKPPPKR